MTNNILDLAKTIFIDRRACISSKGIINPKEEEITDDDICVYTKGAFNIIRTALDFKRNQTR